MSETGEGSPTKKYRYEGVVEKKTVQADDYNKNRHIRHIYCSMRVDPLKRNENVTIWKHSLENELI